MTPHFFVSFVEPHFRLFRLLFYQMSPRKETAIITFTIFYSLTNLKIVPLYILGRYSIHVTFIFASELFIFYLFYRFYKKISLTLYLPHVFAFFFSLPNGFKITINFLVFNFKGASFCSVPTSFLFIVYVDFEESHSNWLNLFFWNFV